MRFTASAAREYHCPRWDELPGIPLYMDQVMIVLEDALRIFAQDDERVVTPTMINNYVKQKFIEPPEKKRYQKRHIAALIVVSVLKSVLSMSEIQGVVQIMLNEYELSLAYNMFCDKLEEALLEAFTRDGPAYAANSSGKPFEVVLHASILALVGKLLVQRELRRAQEEKQETK